MGREIMEVMQDEAFSSGGHGEVIAIRLWEQEVMLAMQYTEADYLMLNKKERARLIVGQKLAGWLGSLDLQMYRKELDQEK